MRHKSKSKLSFTGGLKMLMNSTENVKAETLYEVECFDALGNLKWKEVFKNLVVTAGLNKLLDATFKTGNSSPSWYVGLKNSSAGIAAGDTMASHTGWTESTDYGNPFSARPAFTPGSIASGSVDNSASKASFTMDASTTIYGAFLTDNDGSGSLTTGTLYGVGDFAAARAVVATDVLNVTVTLTQTAA